MKATNQRSQWHNTGRGTCNDCLEQDDKPHGTAGTSSIQSSALWVAPALEPEAAAFVSNAYPAAHAFAIVVSGDARADLGSALRRPLAHAGIPVDDVALALAGQPCRSPRHRA
ncbi:MULTISPECIES: hypothetical protein [Azospirillum]|uniref:Uncharacterized protein n=1 Tax=Azospirillum brasilense TaxID=192 RepID=A0ABU4P5Q7_AZOBR|nr:MULTISPECIES: hypothetical protein [Azospirillum]MDW7552763.1 hypothetical protein [Azospirillum brasilense]MDW7592045.1 hypothetical protein [Azospirillum brasilense]MDW7627678.1 hypothetical protein [Azospirillum brasilense]MDX5952853.1 hypothetical protein [Azospirillum brasilense]TVZ60917.1 hypothetical protein OH82_02756 [Azospirillum brasilense]